MPFQLIVQTPQGPEFLALSKREWGDECIIGRGEASHFRLPDRRRLISSRHAKITQQAGEFVLMDIGSTNGTTINGSRLEIGKPYTLAVHDQIGIGDCVLEFVVVETPPSLEGMVDPDATVCLPQPACLSPRTIVDQLQGQYAEMLHLSPEDRETSLVDILHQALSEIPPEKQEEFLSDVEAAFGESHRAEEVFPREQVSTPEVNQQNSQRSGVGLESNQRDAFLWSSDATEQIQVLTVLFEFLNDSMKGRRQFEKELDVEVTRILGKERQELKWAETGEHMSAFLFDHTTSSIPFPEKLHQLRQVLDDLTLHPLGLIAGFRESVRFLLKQLDPINLEVECKNKRKDLGAKILSMGILGNHPAWEYFKEKHRQLREEEIKTFHRLLGPEIAKGYLRVYQQKAPSSKS
ncbi:MAG: FHA domain-containing protein [Nitrospirota bacterium]|nr:FHA domain-containing protein [Nitrospirota bacterium]MDH5586223.1 FHA domain-containing protein [Nitrospirota bacterium]MDH5774993.1 FHA domain-containing protein [Nitrospirota bacterium]